MIKFWDDKTKTIITKQEKQQVEKPAAKPAVETEKKAAKKPTK